MCFLFTKECEFVYFFLLRQPQLILQMFANMLCENASLQRQMATLTLNSLRYYFLQHIPFSMRNLQLFNVLKEIILFMKTLDPKRDKVI